jgi:hypothetical protein
LETSPWASLAQRHTGKFLGNLQHGALTATAVARCSQYDQHLFWHLCVRVPCACSSSIHCSGCGLDHFCHAGVLTCRIDFHTVDAPECSTSSANSSSKAHQPSAVSRLAASIKARLAGSFSAALGGESPVSLEDDDTGRQMIEAAKVGQVRQENKRRHACLCQTQRYVYALHVAFTQLSQL